MQRTVRWEARRWAGALAGSVNLGKPMGPRFSAALALANWLHAPQTRKGTDIPYIAHLLAVAAIVIEAGGDEELAIAALLHDAVEDQGGQPTLTRIRAQFGERVASVVEACSDTDVVPKPPWRARKQAYIDAVPHKSPDALLVSLADKIHNSEAVLADYRDVGEDVWKRFTGGRDGTLWYYRALTDAFKPYTKPALWRRLDATVRSLEAETAAR